MNKLGIAIKITVDGAGEPIVLNDGEWTRHIADVRPLLNKVCGLNEDSQVIRILSFTDEGCLLTSARLIAGRSGDNIAAWIYIPSDMEISGKEVRYVMDIAEQAILAPTLDTIELEKICQQSYHFCDNAFSKASNGEKLAFRIYDDNSIEDILGPNRYQNYYENYKYIFLFDSMGTLSLTNPSEADDLSNERNKVVSLLIPPTTEALKRHFGFNVLLRLSDGTPFNHPVYLNKGNSISLMLVREYFRPISFNYVKPNNGSKELFPLESIDISKINWQLPLLLSDFNVEDENGNPILSEEHLTIKVNNIILKPDITCWIDEYHAKEASVIITSKSHRYQPKKVTKDITKKPIKVVLPYLRDYKSTTIITQNGEVGKIEYCEKDGSKKGESPIKDYYFKTNGNLVYESHKPWLYRLQGVLATVAVVLLYMFITMIFPSENKKQQSTTKTPPSQISDSQNLPSAGTASTEQTDKNTQIVQNESTPTETIDNDVNYSHEQAIYYLDNNPSWKRNEMEQYPTLQGLFDDMNQYKLEALMGKWKLELEASEQFKKVAETAVKNRRKGWNPATGQHRPFFNKPGDETIVVRNYVYWLDQNQNKPAKNTQQQPTRRSSQRPAAGSGNNSVD